MKRKLVLHILSKRPPKMVTCFVIMIIQFVAQAFTSYIYDRHGIITSLILLRDCVIACQYANKTGNLFERNECVT